MHSFSFFYIFFFIFINNFHFSFSFPDSDQICWPICPDTSQNPSYCCQYSSQHRLSDTYGPRIKFSENRYDWHRGIDIITPYRSPVWNIYNGTVIISGNHPQYSDLTIVIKHNKTDESHFYSVYLHLNQTLILTGDMVVTGQMIAFSGGTVTLDHLHFEIRNNGPFQRNCIHPLSILSYYHFDLDPIVSNITYHYDKELFLVTVTYSSYRLDIIKYGIDIYDSSLTLVQANFPNPDGYYVYPSFLDLHHFNYYYSHIDTSLNSWSSFSHDGSFPCPFSLEHGDSYNPNIHLDNSIENHQIGSFNGLSIIHLFPSSHYLKALRIRFHQINREYLKNGFCLKGYIETYSSHQDFPLYCVKSLSFSLSTFSKILYSVLFVFWVVILK